MRLILQCEIALYLETFSGLEDECVESEPDIRRSTLVNCLGHRLLFVYFCIWTLWSRGVQSCIVVCEENAVELRMPCEEERGCVVRQCAF